MYSIYIELRVINYFSLVTYLHNFEAENIGSMMHIIFFSYVILSA